MEAWTALRLLAEARFPKDARLADGELERLFWAHKGLASELAAEKSFFASTNEALAVAYQQLESQKKELELARGALLQMVASVAHEIRQPISAIKTVGFLLGSRMAQSDEDGQTLRILRSESERLEALMGDLLDFAKPLKLQLAESRVAALLGDAAEAFHVQSPNARLRVEVHADAEAVARFDRLRLMQVLLNLLHNANKHAAGATRVQLEARPREGGVLLTVENDGATIARDVAERIFEPFFTTGKGTGLGLAIARRIVEAHGGTIAVEPLDAGTRFRLELPS
jgi:signal transduction histidine kinase